ncbi:PTS sugar transporter subunit IIA [Megamonas hypermegale]|uniref:PTS sugar transporter subunit IIA n=1 Tax=Megamonas hypermegale TaxID=158847 RepID=UPI0026EACF06|nr:PTS sugar transporter subunit IIA [Megamonas hypermegale]
MDITLKNELILLDVEAENQFNLLEKVADNLHQLGYVKDTYKNAVIEREKVFATGLPTLMGGVAIPHTDIQHVNTPAISIARLKNPVDFVIMGDDTATVAVDLIFMLAMKEEHAQLELLQSLMGILQDEEALSFIKKAPTKEDIRKFVSEKLQIA